MKLSYYEEVTPMGYEPPGFVSAEFDIDHLFQGPTTKYSFGKAVTPFHNVGLSMETVSDDSIRPSTKASTTAAITNSINSQALVFPESIPADFRCKPQSPTEHQNTVDVQEGMNFNESIVIASQVAQAANSPANFPQSQPPAVAPKSAEGSVKKAPAGIFTDLSETQQQIQMIKCTCSHNFKDLEMLQCDRCMNWQHSVCSGYVSCRDRRLENSIYICYFCKYGNQINTFTFLQKLSRFRKALAVISADGFKSISRLSDRLGISKNAGTIIRDRLVSEKFLISNGKIGFAIAKKDDYIKERIKFYFNQNLEIHAEFKKAQEKDNQSGLSHKRRSTEDISDKEPSVTAPPSLPTSKASTATATSDANVPAISTVHTSVDSVTPRSKSIPLEINTIPFEARIPQSPKPALPKTPPETLKKKRKISIPSSRISCYLNSESK